MNSASQMGLMRNVGEVCKVTNGNKEYIESQALEDGRLFDDIVKDDPASSHPFRSASRVYYGSRRGSERRTTP